MLSFRTLLTVMVLMAVLAGGAVTHAGSPALQPEIPTISVSGVIEFDTGSAHVPAEGIRVELRDDDPLILGPGELIAATLTDEFGRYSFEEIDNRDFNGSPRRWDGTGLDVRLLVLTDNDHVAVQAYPGGNAYRWASDAPQLLSARGFYEDVPDGERVTFPKILFKDGIPNFQAVRAFVALNDGWSFVVNEMALPDPGRTVAEWPTLTASEQGYDPEEQSIVLTTGDADSPDAVIHLQAHAFMDNLLRDLGGAYPAECVSEEPIDVETTQTCAWVHGWGVFFAAAAQNDPIYRTASQALSLESPLVDLDDGDAVSARVAGALWDLLDENNDGFDQYTGTFMELWDAISGTPVYTFREFWDASEIPQCEGLTSLAQNTINYNTPPELDPFPDPVTMDEDPEEPPAFDMQARARDAECAFEKLLFDIEDPEADISIELDEDGVLHIVPAENWNGETTVNVRVFDGVDFVAQALHVIVQPVNDAPMIKPAPPDRTEFVGEEIVYQLDSRISDVDHEKDSLTLSVVPVQEPLVPPVDVSIEEGLVVRFAPQNDVPGTNAFEIRVTDPGGAVGRHTVLLTWELLPNQGPALDPTMPLVWEAHKGQAIVMELLTYATDDRDEPSELDWSVDPETVDNATWAGEGDPTQKLIFTPDPASFIGEDEIKLLVQDRDAATSEINVILRWTPEPNIAPQINPPLPDFSTGINRQLVVDLSPYGHDQDDNDAGLRWYVQFVDPEAPNPFVSGQGTQRLKFTPLVDFEGTVETRFVVRDPKGAEAEQVVSLRWQQYKTYMPLLLRPFAQKPGN